MSSLRQVLTTVMTIILVLYSILGVSLLWFIYNHILRNFIRRIQHKPPLVPGLPFLGSALDFAKDSTGFMRNNAQKYGPVFSAFLAGSEFTFITKQKHYQDLFKASDEVLSFDEALKDQGFTVSKKNPHFFLGG